MWQARRMVLPEADAVPVVLGWGVETVKVKTCGAFGTGSRAIRYPRMCAAEQLSVS